MNLYLRPFIDDDLKQFVIWLDKPHVAKWFKHKDSWINEIKHRGDEFSFIRHFIVMDDERAIGFVQYYDYRLGKEEWHGNSDINRTYSIDYLIGEEDYLHKGNGTKIVHLLEEKIKEETDGIKIIVQPESDNLISRKTLLKAGYIKDSEYDFFYKIIGLKD